MSKLSILNVAVVQPSQMQTSRCSTRQEMTSLSSILHPGASVRRDTNDDKRSSGFEVLHSVYNRELRSGCRGQRRTMMNIIGRAAWSSTTIRRWQRSDSRGPVNEVVRPMLLHDVLIQGKRGWKLSWANVTFLHSFAWRGFGLQLERVARFWRMEDLRVPRQRWWRFKAFSEIQINQKLLIWADNRHAEGWHHNLRMFTIPCGK